jgi:hypothetical protein
MDGHDIYDALHRELPINHVLDQKCDAQPRPVRCSRGCAISFRAEAIFGWPNDISPLGCGVYERRAKVEA